MTSCRSEKGGVDKGVGLNEKDRSHSGHMSTVKGSWASLR